MEQEVIERFERIEADIAAAAKGLAMMVQAQAGLQNMLSGLVESISRYTDASNVRMMRVEENLDALIRAITAEHSNGRT